MPKVYTKKGDNGTTTLYSGQRISKSNIIFEILGTLDELNANLGICPQITSYYTMYGYKIISWETHLANNYIKKIQQHILDLSSQIATISGKYRDKVAFKDLAPIIETWIDQIDAELPRLTTFIKPDNQYHVARTICRRAERQMCLYRELIQNGELYHVKKNKEGEDEYTYFPDIPEQCYRYINRLSDLLFNIGRLYTQLS